jgi:antitoxin (DNA-binding transcriptional repressor) of toxin-antitoxin stability system
MITVTSAYAKIHLPKLLDQLVRTGESVTILKYKKPIAELTLVKGVEKPRPKFGTLRGKVKILDPDWARPMTDQEADDFIHGRY